jgi:hypothetical protein
MTEGGTVSGPMSHQYHMPGRCLYFSTYLLRENESESDVNRMVHMMISYDDMKRERPCAA